MGCAASKPPEPPAPVERTASAIDLDKLLSAAGAAFAPFEEFAAAEHSSENLVFLRSVKAFRDAAAGTDTLGEEASKQAAAIIDTHLWKRAKQKVNLPSDELEPFRDRSDNGTYAFTVSMFDAAYARCSHRRSAAHSAHPAAAAHTPRAEMVRTNATSTSSCGVATA
eukprot:3273265-Prymnesium_polylepis.1